LLDIFSKVPISDQLNQATEFLKRLADKTYVAVCSRNDYEIQIPTPWLPTGEPLSSAAWLQEMAKVSKLILDGQTVLIANELIVTTIPYSFPIRQKLSLMERGENLKANHRSSTN
jgi:hypothetical protein